MSHLSDAAKVTVIGSSKNDPVRNDAAYNVGKILGDLGAILITGGRGGVMESVSRGHRENNGISIGILPGSDENDSNLYNTINLPTGIGYARNLTNILAGDMVIVVGGSVGTLTELGYAIQHKKPILLLRYLAGVSAIPKDFVKQLDSNTLLDSVENPDDLKEKLKEWFESRFLEIKDQKCKSFFDN